MPACDIQGDGFKVCRETLEEASMATFVSVTIGIQAGSYINLDRVCAIEPSVDGSRITFDGGHMIQVASPPDAIVGAILKTRKKNLRTSIRSASAGR